MLQVWLLEKVCRCQRIKGLRDLAVLVIPRVRRCHEVCNVHESAISVFALSVTDIAILPRLADF